MTAYDRNRAEPRNARLLEPGRTCCGTPRANRFAMIVDAAEYFAAAREAMLAADDTILLVGWDFDLRIDLAPGRDDVEGPTRLGPFLKYLVRRKPHLRIRVLRWDMSVLYNLGTQVIPMIALDVEASERIKLRFDSNHPWSAAHHQKIAVIDDSLAFCGGIDMTTDRWDTRGHLPGDTRRRQPDGRESGPWHDLTAVMDGDAARDLGRIARRRWQRATGSDLPAPSDYRDRWPTCIAPLMEDVDVGIARTMPPYRDQPRVNEVENLALAAIWSARDTIYLESQYFASQSICDALRARLSERGGPEVVVVNPLSTFGWLEQHTMGTSRDLRLTEITRADRHRRFAIYHPVNAAREPIYVHAKVLVVDDRLMRIGSSNINNRSMGFDTECDVAVEAASDDQRAAISDARDDLLAEHLDTDTATIRQTLSETGSLLRTVETLRREDGRSLEPIPRREVNSLEETVTKARVADPETPAQLESRATHIAKQAVLRVPPSAWVTAGATGLAVVLATGALRNAVRRRRRRSG
ncbi:phospholipase D-like domain-containing protein [Tranquillimonas alkanivorans]|uniref:Phospholipase D n=1 Tax=Tranquillimonas alkanivorans TaxID=441119 RepID=A0A1I5S2C4_9RHOB|nr:phospholipase D-like domain-containing protein [Tranquillimonas alkanivorans]SFP64741.1 phospholipase D1/2 [Tranquillimonas alkanivorans]